MKKTTLILLFTLLLNSSFGQCYDDRHNTSWFDGWISCEKSDNPNAIREKSHWILYDFGQVYALHELKVWNVNDPDLLDFGAQNVAIDYSLDGVNWINFKETTFPKAPGISTYEGDIVTNFEGLKARFILVTVLDNYGGECAGFSEFRVAVDSTKDENEDICIIAESYPNPFQQEFSVFLKKKCLGDAFVAVEDATGRTVYQEQLILLNETKLIPTRGWTAGVYYVCVRNGDILERYKVVKL